MDKIKEIQKLIKKEKKALSILENNVNKEYIKALSFLKKCKGKIIVIGIGKSGHIGNKIAATLSSTGSPSLFLHGTEALHGDLGVINKNDVIIIISNSGCSQELLELIPYLKKIRTPIISITSNINSPIAKKSNAILNIGKQKEIDSHNLAPTSSSTATLVVGDILAISLSKEKKFEKENFAIFHPNGSLGKRLSITIEDLMHSGKNNAIVGEKSTIKHIITQMTLKSLGAVCVIDNNYKLKGIITDGDLRRSLDIYKDKIFKIKAEQIMTKRPVTVLKNELAFNALKIMEKRKSQISVLPVVNKKNELIGLIRLHDIVQAGI